MTAKILSYHIIICRTYLLFDLHYYIIIIDFLRIRVSMGGMSCSIPKHFNKFKPRTSCCQSYSSMYVLRTISINCFNMYFASTSILFTKDYG